MNLIDYNNYNHLQRMIDKQMKYIWSLSSAKAYEKSCSEEVLIEFMNVIFNELFSEDISFSKRDISDVVINMLSILYDLNVCYLPDDEFRCFEIDKENLCVSHDILKCFITRIESLSKTGLFYYAKLSDESKKEDSDEFKIEDYTIIKKISSIIRKSIETVNLTIERLLKYLAIFCHVRDYYGVCDDEILKNKTCIPCEYYGFIREVVIKIDDCLSEKNKIKLNA